MTELERLKEELSAAVAAAENLETGEPETREAWLGVVAIQKRIVGVTTPTDKDGIAARESAVIIALKIDKGLAMKTVTEFLMDGNITPNQFSKMKALLKS